MFVGETRTFDHFMFNGPDYFKIRVDEYRPWMYIGNVYKTDLDIVPVYKYFRQENDLNKLLSLWQSP